MIEKVISGGQTGADIGALVGAKRAGVATGGTAAQNWMTERGPQESVLRGFGLAECQLSGYPPRTKQNILDSSATAIFMGPTKTRGTDLTIKLCRETNWIYLAIPWHEEDPVTKVRAFCTRYNVKVLNVAGPRESSVPGMASRVARIVFNVLRDNR